MKDERLVSKMEGKTIFFEALETVRWLSDPEHPLFYDRSTPF